MTRATPMIAAAATLVVLAAGLAAVFDSSRTIHYLAAAILIAALPCALFIRQFARGTDPDWRLTAPALLVVCLLSLARGLGLFFAAGVFLAGAAMFRLAPRQRMLGAASQFTAAALLMTTAGGIGLIGWVVGAGHQSVAVFLAAVAAWLLLWMPPRIRRINDRQAVDIRRPPEEVSAYLLDQRNLVAWYPGYVSSELVGGPGPRKGSVFRQAIGFRGRAQEGRVIVDEYEPGRRLCTRLLDVPGRGGSCYTFAPENGGTAAVYEYIGEQLYPSALVGSMLFMSRALSRVRVQRQNAFEKLKAILET